jgi:enoyl-CoA hydratase/carnithine racemase
MREIKMGYESILYTKIDRKAVIMLNRPDRMNAMNRSMFMEIGQALDDADRDNNISVVIMKGNGKCFSTGVDLKFATAELQTLQDQQDFFRVGNQMVLEKIEKLSKPVIAAVHGYCLAGGFEVMMAADIVIAADDAKIGDQHINVGVLGGGGCAYRLALLVGLRKAKEIILTGKILSGKEAERIGVVNMSVPAAELESATEKMADEICLKSPVALRLSKWYINRVSMIDADSRLELAIMYSLIDATSEDKVEGMQAFLEKRKPNFKGR